MKKFRVQIFAYQLRADFIIESLDGPIDIENAIIDKLGKNEVKFESNGFTRKDCKSITYEEVSNDRRPLHYETVLGTRVATRAPEVREA